MASKITTTAQEAQIHGVKVLVYSKSGMGKTYMARTAPAPLVISAEAGVLSLRDVAIPMWKVKSVEDLTEIYNWATTSAEARQFATLYIDSLSEIGEVVLANAKKQVRDPRQAYGELIEKMFMVIKSFRDLSGKHVVMTAKMEPTKDELTGIVTYGPSMPGSKLGPQLPYLFDEVFRLGLNKTPQGEQYRFLQTQPDIQHEAKDRSGALAPLEPCDINYIFNKILTGAR